MALKFLSKAFKTKKTIIYNIIFKQNFINYRVFSKEYNNKKVHTNLKDINIKLLEI